jgi:release factor glutamine methyltransferase
MDALENTTLKGVHDWFCRNLLTIVDPNESKAMAGIIFEHYLGLSSTDILLRGDKGLSESEVSVLEEALNKLLHHVPVQYVTGQAFFRDLVLKVNNHVLIPRPETEELVQWVLDLMCSPKPANPCKIWDVGTGSGAIALSLAAECANSFVWASDISTEALAVAHENCLDQSLNVSFFQHDILRDKLPSDIFDVVVSNPPYIREQEKGQMQSNVLDFEPHNALFVPDDDPLLFYSALVMAGKDVLKQGGILVVEINEELGMETKNLFENIGFGDVEVKKDLRGKDRFVKGVWKK